MTESLSREPSFDESINAIIGAHLAEIHTALPGKVVRYDAATGKADVKPVILRFYEGEDGGEIEVPYPVVTNVPVMFPRGGGAFVSLPLKPDDPVWLLFSQRSLDRYLETDGTQEVDTEDARRHHLSDALCYPGGGTWRNAIPNAHPDDLVIGIEDEGAEIHVTPGGDVWVKAGNIKLGASGAAKALALAETVDARLSQLEYQVTLPHGNGNFGGPTVPPLFTPGAGGASTASSKVFADS